MSTLLPKIQNPQEYSILYKENTLWDTVIEHIARHRDLNGSIQRSPLGSHIVYRIGEYWIKLMAPIYAEDMKYEINGLRAIAGKLSVATPVILFEGDIESWKYIVMSHVEGQPVRHIWKDLSPKDKLSLAEQMARIISEIGRCESNSEIQNRFSWNDFIHNQYERIESVHRAKGLPEDWVSGVKGFIQSASLSDFQIQQPILMHADLTFDHFLISLDPAPQVSGIIDMADCQVGHPEYEILVPCCFIFKGDKEVLRHFLKSCGFQDSQLNHELSYKFMRWAILHRYCVLQKIFAKEMETCEAGDFHQLAEMIFPM